MRVRATAWRDLRKELTGSQIVGFSAGPDQRIYILLCLGEPDSAWIDRRSAADFRVLVVGSDELAEYLIPEQLTNFGLVQPLGGELLLATRRCEYSESFCKPNGQIFDLDGVSQGSVMLGDGILHLQTTKSGEIWTAYFDEGIFGNLGWKRPIGAKGLLRFSTEGDRIYEFQPAGGLDEIADCYALNVVSNFEAWCYYYSEFPLVKIVDDRVEQFWKCPIQGAGVFAVWRDSVLMTGGYHRREEWNLMTLSADGRSRLDWTGRIEDDLGSLDAPVPSLVTARGPNIWYLRSGIVFHIDLKDLANK